MVAGFVAALVKIGEVNSARRKMKYRMAQGQPMIFAWKASAPVHYDMHSVPDQGGNDATESFVITDGPAQSAVAPRAP